MMDRLNKKLQELYNAAYEVSVLAPSEDNVPNKNWEELFIEISNLINAYKNIGTEDGIVPDLMTKYEEAMIIARNTRPAAPGDIVTVNEISVTISKIFHQIFWPSDRNDGTCDWNIEFRDSNGVCRIWKQYFDGGHITLL